MAGFSARLGVMAHNVTQKKELTLEEEHALEPQGAEGFKMLLFLGSLPIIATCIIAYVATR